MYRLRCIVQDYHWGCRGDNSVVAELKKLDDPSFEVSNDRHYAEYWFGTHASGPSEILVDGKYQTLKSFVESNPSCLGKSIGVPKLELPFLSKVLSVETALSIQAHPDKALAEKLFVSKPDLYKDDNHKPEMAYALTPFIAMCGFRRAEEIVQNLQNCSYLRNLIGNDECIRFEDIVKNHGDVKKALHSLFSAYIEVDAARAIKQINGMKSYLQEKESLNFVEQWVLRLISQYPSDCGVFAPYLLNTITMQPGDSIYMGADIPHAYLQGEIVESMACSNNVVRAGLTPKAIDKETLLSMLTYECGDVTILHPIHIDEHYAVVETPAVEFMLEILEVKKGENVLIPTIPVPRVLIGFRGNGTIISSSSMEVKRGSILFQVASNEATIVAEEDMIIYATHEKFCLFLL